jgi:DNA-binding transcriptional ArsR family regulator
LLAAADQVADLAEDAAEAGEAPCLALAPGSNFEKHRNELDSRRPCCNFDDCGNEVRMRSQQAVSALGALAQEHRLALFRLLVRSGETGMAAGAIAEALGLPPSSLSFHLAQLSRAGLVEQERRHRSIIYRANYAAMNELVGYLMENCCAGADCGFESAVAPLST